MARRPLDHDMTQKNKKRDSTLGVSFRMLMTAFIVSIGILFTFAFFPRQGSICAETKMSVSFTLLAIFCIIGAHSWWNISPIRLDCYKLIAMLGTIIAVGLAFQTFFEI